MSDLKNDPVINVVHEGIKRGIRVALENGCLSAAIILIYSGIDAMAYLGMPPGQDDVTRDDFVAWAERYIHFPCEKQLSGLDLYGTRCAMLHTYSIVARLTREGKCRRIGYVDQSTPEVSYNPKSAKDLVIVSIKGLAEAFLRGIDQFLVDVFADKGRGPVVEARLKKCVHTLPCEPEP